MPSFYDTYTNIAVINNDICIRLRHPETKHGEYYKITDFTPTTFSLTSSEHMTDGWKTLDGTPLRQRVHKNIKTYNIYVDQAAAEGKKIFGVISPMHQFMASYTTSQCGVPFDSIRAAFLDIEVETTGGFATPENPYQPVTAITVEIWGTYWVWGFGDYTPTSKNINYTKCKNENTLLTSFIKWWTTDYPDIITGWNTSGYDIPYIIKRINLLHKDGHLKWDARVLSPWRKITSRSITIMGREQELIDIVGVASLDYLDLYKKFSSTQRESYRLDAIAEAELGKKKLSYDEYGSLQKLAEEDYQKFISYNITDVELVRALNNKLHHLDLCVQIAYGARTNYVDTFKPVRLWDAMMYYELFSKHIAVPTKIDQQKNVDFMGAYVKVPIVGEHSWVVSFDVNSLYPSIMRQWNISPDRHLSIEWLRNRLTQIEYEDVNTDIQVFSSEECTPREWITNVSSDDIKIVRWALQSLIEYLETSDIDSMLRDISAHDDPWPWLRVLSVTVSPNKQAFRVDHIGFLSEMLAALYNERSANKKIATNASKEVERIEHILKERGVQF